MKDEEISLGKKYNDVKKEFIAKECWCEKEYLETDLIEKINSMNLKERNIYIKENNILTEYVYREKNPIYYKFKDSDISDIQLKNIIMIKGLKSLNVIKWVVIII